MSNGSCYPYYRGRVVHTLDGIWDFHLTDGAADPAAPDLDAVVYDDRLPVPGVFDTLPRYAARRGTAYYRTVVSVTPGARLMLKCSGLGMWGAFFWDGKRVGIQDLPYSEMEFCFDAGEGSEHELVAVIDNRFDFQRQPLLSPFFDFYCHGGIFRTVTLHELPAVALDRAQVRVTDLAAGKVRVEVSVSGDELPAGITISTAFDDEAPVRRKLTLREGKAKFTAALADKRVWTCETPVLHTLKVTLGGETLVERFGLRTVKAEKGKILLNGEPVRLLGYCRHEAHPEFGPALPAQIVVEDFQLLKQVGCNFVRGSHYPQDPRFLDLCDEMGMMVWEEALGWGNTPEQITAPHFAAAQLRQLAPMVKKSGNHPSVILWGFLNEGASAEESCRPLYRKMIDGLHQLDASRPVTYATKCFVRDLNFDLADVISLNIYPGWYAEHREEYHPTAELAPKFDSFLDFLHERGFDDKPMIMSEVGAGAIYGFRDRFRTFWTEEYQADLLEEVLKYFFSRDRVAGISLWQFIDCRTYASAYALNRPRSFNNKGIFDEYRRGKLGAEVVTRYFHNARAKK